MHWLGGLGLFFLLLLPLPPTLPPGLLCCSLYNFAFCGEGALQVLVQEGVVVTNSRMHRKLLGE